MKNQPQCYCAVCPLTLWSPPCPPLTLKVKESATTYSVHVCIALLVLTHILFRTYARRLLELKQQYIPYYHCIYIFDSNTLATILIKFDFLLAGLGRN